MALLEIAKEEQNAFKKAVTRPKYEQAFEAAGDAKIDVSSVVNAAENILDRPLSSFDPTTAPATVRKLLSLKPKGKPHLDPLLLTPKPQVPEATLGQLDDIRKAINADIAAAKTSAAPGTDTALRNLYKLHESIDDAVGKSTALSDTAKTLYADAVQTYRTEYVPRFKTGLNANLFKQTALNEPKLNADDVIGKFFQPKGEREAEQFVAMYGKNPEAMRIAKLGIEDLYRQKTAPQGLVDPKLHAKFMSDYARPIAALDAAGMNLSQDLSKVGRTSERLASLREEAKSLGNQLVGARPVGENAMLIQQRVADLTKGFTPQQMTSLKALADDLARSESFSQLAKEGLKAGPKANVLASFALQEASGGKSVINPLNRIVTVANLVLDRLQGRLNQKLALEIAREMLNPEAAAAALEAALVRKAGAEVTAEYAGKVAKPAAIGLTQVPARVSVPEPQNRNALAR